MSSNISTNLRDQFHCSIFFQMGILPIFFTGVLIITSPLVLIGINKHNEYRSKHMKSQNSLFDASAFSEVENKLSFEKVKSSAQQNWLVLDSFRLLKNIFSDFKTHTQITVGDKINVISSTCVES